MSGRVVILYLLLIGFSCSRSENPPAFADEFAAIPAGEYEVGAKNHRINPLRKVNLKAYRISRREITNAQFAEFVAATGYVTDAEQYHTAMIFYPGLGEFDWEQDSTANWRFPNGVSRGGIQGKMDHPVTCISYHDIMAYCDWRGLRLPTLDEWEVACRAGSGTRYFWGSESDRIAQYANIWHAKNHQVADTSDVFQYTSPVGHFAPNPNGLFDVYGNVFEFCADRPAIWDSLPRLACARGGSWWCSKNSCSFFNSVDIGRVNARASFSNQGFRVAE